MLKTKLFIRAGSLGGIHEYEDFIRKNPTIEVISVNISRHNAVLLTYRD